MKESPKPMTPEDQSSKPQEDSSCQNEQDVVLDLLKEAGLPLTRENYLSIAYFGDPPKELGAEEEAELPEEVQRK